MINTYDILTLARYANMAARLTRRPLHVYSKYHPDHPCSPCILCSKSGVYYTHFAAWGSNEKVHTTHHLLLPAAFAKVIMKRQSAIILTLCISPSGRGKHQTFLQETTDFEGYIKPDDVICYSCYLYLQLVVSVCVCVRTYVRTLVTETEAACARSRMYFDL